MRNTRPLVFGFSLLLLGACGKKPAADAPAPQPGSAIGSTIGSPVARAAQDPCALLDPKDVEAALGQPLAVAPYRSEDGQAKAQGTPVQDGSACRYESADFHNIHVGVLWRNGPHALELLRKFSGIVRKGSDKVVTLSKGTTLDGSWDDAQLVGCCDFYALLGERAVDVDVGGSKATVQQAAALADAALRHLDHPLPVDGNAALAAAQAHAAQRPQLGPACGLLGRAAIEAIIGPLSAEPIQRNARNCEVHTATEAYSFGVADASNGYRGMRAITEQLAPQSQALTAAANGLNEPSQAILANVAAGVQQKLVVNPAWDTAVVSMQGLRAVKKDVQIQVAPTFNPAQVDKATRLAAAIMNGY
jgi:hypothetical protein